MYTIMLQHNKFVIVIASIKIRDMQLLKIETGSSFINKKLLAYNRL